MTSASNPVLPLLSLRIRYYCKGGRGPPIAIRQRYKPYPQRTDSLPPARIPCFSPGSASLLTSSESKPQDPSGISATASDGFDTDLVPLKAGNGFIPKPAGEAGRLDGRGYNVAAEMKWNLEDAAKLKVFPCLFESSLI